jgi:hypothetical protein
MKWRLDTFFKNWPTQYSYLFQMYCRPYAEEPIEHIKYQETELMANKND